MSPPGWYPDAFDPSILRWWDGSRWTEHTAPAAPAPPSGDAQPSGTGRPPEFDSAPLGPPSSPPRPGPGPGTADPGAGATSPLPGGRQPWWQSSWAIVGGILVVLLVGAVSVVALLSGSDSGDADDRDDGGDVPSPSNPVGSSPDPDGDDDPDDPDADDDPEPDTDPDLDDGVADGTRSQPFRFGEQVPVRWSTYGDGDGSVWNTVVGRPRDITADVLAENEYNESPPDGVVFLGFDVTMTLVEAEVQPLSPGLSFGWEALGGATSGVYDIGTIETENFGCGVAPSEFGDFDEVFVGGRIEGTVCLPVPAEDAGDPGTQIAMNFFEGRVVFAADGGDGPSPAEVPSPGILPPDGGRPGDGSAERPFDYDTPAEITFDTYGDEDGSVWTTTVGPPRDITDDLLAENPYNERPPDGVAFVGFDVTMTLESADVEPISPAIGFAWEVWGGATARVYSSYTLEVSCGVVPTPLDDYSEVLVGGSLTGTVCIPVPVDDLDNGDTSIVMNFSGAERIVFHSSA